MATVVGDALGISNLIPSDLAEVTAEKITEAESLVFAQQPTHGVRVSFVLSGHALDRMTEPGIAAVERLMAPAERGA